MRERNQQLRQTYSTYPYDKLKKVADELCRDVHDGKGFIETYPNDFIDKDDLIDEVMHLHDLKDFQELTLTVIEQKEVMKKPVSKQEQLDTGDDTVTLLDLWREKWDMRIIHQEIPRDLTCLSFLSQHFKHITIYKGVDEDIRLHVCLIMPSGTGKSDGNDILSKCCELTGLTTHYLDRYTDAILTGSIDQKKIDKNIRLKLNPGDLGYQDPHQKSALDIYNFVIFDEAENILKSTPATEGAQRILQKAMNRYGSAANEVTNSLIGNTVSCFPSCNIIMTSYYLKEFKATLLERGLLQRMVVYISPENEQCRNDIINKIVDSVPTFKGDVSEAQEKKNVQEEKNRYIDAKIVAEVERLKEFHQDTESIFIHEDVNPIIKEVINTLRDMLPMYATQRQVWNSMVSRLTINILKMSALYAIMHYRTYVTERDVRQATALLIKTMESVGVFLRENFQRPEPQVIKKCYTILKKSSYAGLLVEQDILYNLLVEENSIKPSMAFDVIESLVQGGKISAVITDGKRKLKVNVR